jgi:CO/xanthine dehydrogenase Mo-binding subunit
VALEFGDVDEGFHAAEYIREDSFFFQGNTHLPMEQHAALAQYTPDGALTLWSATQTPHYVHRALATVLGLPASRVRVIATPVGGGFGGKSDMFAHECCAAKLSMLTGRPVKICLTREEVFYAHRGRHPVLMWVRTGVKRNGAITALHFKTFVDGGGYSSYGVASVLYTGALQTVTYKIPHYRFEGLRVFTNMQVEVDPVTGWITVPKVWIGHDIGKALNLYLVQGQVEGSVYMAIGEALMEEQVFRKGVHKMPSLLEYKSPTFLEMPEVDTVLIESLDPQGPYGAKEAGQGPLLPVLPALANAVYDAVGVRIDEMPITPEKVLKALALRDRGQAPRVGPRDIPAFSFPPARKVERPEEWLQVVPDPATRRP